VRRGSSKQPTIWRNLHKGKLQDHTEVSYYFRHGRQHKRQAAEKEDRQYMKIIRIFAIAALCIAAFSTAVSGQGKSPSAPGKVVMIDTNEFFAENGGITKMIATSKQLNSEFASQISVLREGNEKINAINAELENMTKLPATQFDNGAYNKKEDEARNLRLQLTRKKADLERAVEARRKALFGPLQTEIGNAIGEFAKKNGFSAVFDSSKALDSGAVLFIAEKVDVTREFIAFFNAKP
jgi:Skp family chaperone for outer membrane proteins